MAVLKGKWKLILSICSFFFFVGSLIYLILAPRPVEVEVASVSRGSLIEVIRSEAVLRSKKRETVVAMAEGDLAGVSLKAGDEVKKGEKITSLTWDIRVDPVNAPLSGVVSRVFRESAGPIRRGDPIVEIIDPVQLEIVAELLTTDAVRLKEGAEAWVENWGSEIPLSAQVSRISKAGFTKPSALGVEEERTEVVAQLVGASPALLELVGDSFHVDVTFKVREIKNALKIPLGAVFKEHSQWFVYTEEHRRAQKTPIEIGMRTDKEVQVISGLAENQTVIIYPGDLVKDKVPLRPRVPQLK